MGRTENLQLPLKYAGEEGKENQIYFTVRQENTFVRVFLGKRFSLYKNIPQRTLKRCSLKLNLFPPKVSDPLFKSGSYKIFSIIDR